MFKKGWVRRQVAKLAIGHKVISAAELYRELDHTQKEIRVLKVQPGEEDQPIHCSLHSAYLQHGPSCAYETISYVWGDVSLRGSVFVNGQHVDVPASTEVVLRRMRHTDRARTVWIDSLCINLNNVEERSRQVTLMAEIYTHTAQNLIWLGEDEFGDSEESIRAIKAILADMNHEAPDVEDLYELIWGHSGISTRSEKPISTDVDWSAIEWFFQSPWFKRLWVIQEASLPAKGVCFRGKSQIQVDALLKVVCWIDYKFAVANTGWRQLPHGITCALDIFHFADEDLGAFRSWSKLEGTPQASNIFYVKADTDPPTDIRDYIYSRIGLYQKITSNHDLPRELIPDYSLSYQEVFHRAARAIVTLDRDLGILGNVHLDPNEHDLSLASWVPRWYQNYRTEGSNEWRHRGHADGEHVLYDLTLQFPRGSSVLSTTGISVGVIVRCSDIFHRPASPEARLAFYRRLFDTTYDFLATYDLYRPKTQSNSWYRTLMGGIDAFRNDCNADRAKALCVALLESIYHEGRVPQTTRTLPRDATSAERDRANCADAVYKACNGRQLLMTNTGHLGVGQPGVKVGDIVTVLFGCRYLCVLRPIDLQSDSYRYVGSSLISVLSDGEAVHDWKARGDIEEIFHLY